MAVVSIFQIFILKSDLYHFYSHYDHCNVQEAIDMFIANGILLHANAKHWTVSDIKIDKD